MRTVIIISIAFVLSLQSALAQQPTASAAGVAHTAELVSADIAGLNAANQKIREVIRAKQISKKKRTKAEGLFDGANDVRKKLTRYRKKYRSLSASILKREVTGLTATKKQTARYFRFFSKSSRLGNSGDRLIDKINNFVASNPIIPTAQFGGSWNTNFGLITFTQNSRNVVGGTYLYSGGGTVSGRVKAKRLAGRYRGDGVSGSFVIIMNDSNTAWAGSYTTSDGTLTEGWSATKR